MTEDTETTTPLPSLVDSLREQVEAIAGAARPATVAAVMVSFNKREDVRQNLDGIFSQTRPFDEVIVVDNCSGDGTADMIRAQFPDVDLVVMPHTRFGACETFNIGFWRARSDYIAILDDDVVLPPEWLEKVIEKVAAEPPTTALISSQVTEPGMPEWYIHHPIVNRERYMATFRGCATLARRDVLEACGGYDEGFFIYGNERDLTCRVLDHGWRVIQFSAVRVRHGTPFGMKPGPRSLYYHVRNLWWYLFKYVAFWQIVHFFVIQILLKFKWRRERLTVDAIGTIGIYRVIGETPRGWHIVLRATGNAFLGLARCLRLRRVCKAPDFALPTK